MIDDNTLLQFLQTEEGLAVDTQLNDERETALDFYRGEPFGDEIDGRSKLRTRDVAEVVNHMTVSVMGTLVSGDHIVEFEPVRPVMVMEGEAQRDVAVERAQEATEVVHWNFMREQDGYRILHDGIKSGMLEKAGVWKTWVETPMLPETVRLNTNDLEARDDVTEAQEVPGMYDIDPLTGESLAVYDAVVMVEGEPVFKDAAISSEEFFVSPDTRTLDDAAYVGNTTQLSLAQLVDLGYEWEDVENLYSSLDGSAETLSQARDKGRSYQEGDVVRRDYNRVVTLREEYVRWFWEGRLQLVRVHRVGTTILGVEPASMQPYVLWSPVMMPHRLIGQSIADQVLDIQVVRSHMLRQAMDNLYLSNAPRTFLPEEGITDNTIDDLLDVAPGAIIRGKLGAPPVPWKVPFVAENAFRAMEIMAQEKTTRTGITPLNQGLKPDALNIDTATTFRGLSEKGQQIEEYVARNAANAIGELFEKKLRLMIAYRGPGEFKMDGEVKEINPQDWPQDMRLSVKVGLGTGNRDKRLMNFGMLREAMAEAAQFGLVGREEAFAAAKLLVSNLGFGMATQYFKDPATMGDEQEQPDPELQAKMAELQAKQQESAAKLDLQRQEMEARLQMQMFERQMQMEMDRAKTAEEAELAYDRLMAEFQLKREQMALKVASDVEMGKMREGGRLDQ